MKFQQLLTTSYQRIPSNYLGDLIQIWDFFQNFCAKLNLQKSFSIDDLFFALENENHVSDLLDFLISQLYQFVFTELINQKAHNSNYFMILEQVQSAALRKFIIYQTWPIFFGQISKINKMRNVFQDDVKQEYLNLSRLVQESRFTILDFANKINFVLFNINWIAYEIDSIGNDFNEQTDIEEEVNINSLEKQKKQWTLQLKKIRESLNSLENELQKTKRRNKKNQGKQQRLQLENEIEDLKSNEKRLQKLITYNPFKNNTIAKCQLLKKLSENTEFWKIDNDAQYLYIRFVNEHTDLWFQLNYEDIITLKNQLSNKDIQTAEIHSYLNEINQQGIIKPTKASIQNNQDEEYRQFFIFEQEIEKLIENEFNLDFIRKIYDDLDILKRIKYTLLDLENDYSQYEIKYWKCCWTSKEKREIWRQRVNDVADLFELQTIIQKFPHQLSFVNRKHALENPKPELKYKSFRLYWFYQNKMYSQPYQSLIKGAPDLWIMFVLVITLYEKLKFYIHKKINQILMNQLQQNFDEQSSERKSEEKSEDEVEEKSEESQVCRRLRQRKTPVNYKENEKLNNISTSSKKKIQKVLEKNKSETSSTPLQTLNDLDEYQYIGTRQLRARKKIKYDV